MKYKPEVKQHEQVSGTLRATKRALRDHIATAKLILRRGLTIKGAPMKEKQKRALREFITDYTERLKSLD